MILAECSLCLLGYYCNYDSHEPQDCPEGSYCDFNSEYPKPCPKGTYQPYKKMGQLNDCLPCRSGYTCSDEGIGNLQKFREIYACPLGKYCERGIDIDPIPCIAGSYRDDITEKDDVVSVTFTGAFHKSSNSNPNSIKDCNLCPDGFFCPIGTGYRYDNPCPDGFTCPPGSGLPQKCPPG